MNLVEKRNEIEDTWNELVKLKETKQNEVIEIDKQLMILKGKYDAYTEMINEESEETKQSNTPEQ